MSVEVNFDGIVGPTHNYSGLSYGNIASIEYQKLASHPKEAALQGLAKMKYLMELGIPQAVLPPHERPFLPLLRAVGFEGSDVQVLAKVAKEAPDLLSIANSASSMWTANAATVSPSVDSADHCLHITPANLSSKLHRSIECQTTALLLQRILPTASFTHHLPLPTGSLFADEGAANHTRFCKTFDKPGVQLFVFGRYDVPHGMIPPLPQRFPARQTFEASQAIARLHRLTKETTVFAQQHPNAIDAGVFHNDVISIGHQNLFLYHEQAFVDSDRVIEEIEQKVMAICQTRMLFIKIPKETVSLEDAVRSYLFNSQLITLPNGAMHLIAPSECQEIPSVAAVLADLLHDANNPITSIYYFNLRESMRNGGGPACLRLRVVLTQQELASIHPHILLTSVLYEQLIRWVERYYREQLTLSDLADPKLLSEGQEALDHLTAILKLGSIYSFQKLAN